MTSDVVAASILIFEECQASEDEDGVNALSPSMLHMTASSLEKTQRWLQDILCRSLSALEDMICDPHNKGWCL